LRDIIGFGEVEFPFLIEETKSPAETNEKNRVKTSSSLFTEEGFQYDRYLERFRSGKIGVLKSLMKISQKTGALYAAILTKEDDNWFVFDSVGFDKVRKSEPVLKTEDAFYQNYLRSRQPVLFDLEEVGEKLDALVSERDKEYIRTILFLPAQLKGENAFLYLGMKSVPGEISTVIRSFLQL
jgi:hypothetical protein